MFIKLLNICVYGVNETFSPVFYGTRRGQTVCDGPPHLRGQRLSELGLWLRRQCHPGLAHQDYLFFVAIGFIIFGVGTVLAWTAGSVIVLCQRCVRWRSDRPNVDVTEEEIKTGQSG